MKVSVTGCINCPFLHFEYDQHKMWCWCGYVYKEGDVVEAPAQIPAQCALSKGYPIVIEPGL